MLTCCCDKNCTTCYCSCQHLKVLMWMGNWHSFSSSAFKFHHLIDSHQIHANAGGCKKCCLPCIFCGCDDDNGDDKVDTVLAMVDVVTTEEGSVGCISLKWQEIAIWNVLLWHSLSIIAGSLHNLQHIKVWVGYLDGSSILDLFEYWLLFGLGRPRKGNE